MPFVAELYCSKSDYVVNPADGVLTEGTAYCPSIDNEQCRDEFVSRKWEGNGEEMAKGR